MRLLTALLLAFALIAPPQSFASDVAVVENAVLESSQRPQPNTRRVSLVYINDVHAQLEPHPELFWENGEEEFVADAGGLSRVATVVNRLRAERPGELLFIDGGDTIQGSGPAAWSDGQVVVEPTNALGLDVAIPGNWAIAYGTQAWEQRAEEFEHPIVAANMANAKTGELLFAPYLIREINGVRVGIIGFTEPDIPTRQPPHLSEGLVFHTAEVLPPLIRELRETHRADLVVVATHIGLPKAVLLAESLQGVDVVLSADTHERTYEPIIRGDTWVVEAGAFASFVGVLDITVDKEGEIVERTWRLIELRPDLFPEDPEVKRIVDEALAPHRQRMNQIIGHTDIWLARYEVLNTSLDGLIADAIHEATGADVALSNGFRFAPPTAPGPITEADLWTWLPLRLELKQGEAMGSQLHQYWERELENVLSNDPERLFGGWLPRVAGMTVDFEIAHPLKNVYWQRRLVKHRSSPTAGTRSPQAIEWRTPGQYSPGRPLSIHPVIRNHHARRGEGLFASAFADRINSSAESAVYRQPKPLTFSSSPSTGKDRVMTKTSNTIPAASERSNCWQMRASIGATIVLMVMLTVTAATTAWGHDAQAAPEAAGERAVIGIEHQGPIRVVYQITSDDMKNGVGAGLFYLKKLHASYIAAGIDPDQLDIRAVYHGPASAHLLTDEAWNRHRNETAGNPNTAILSELAQRNVHVELCNTRRISNGWAKSDVHPDVLLVSGAYQRLIDLQIRGYAYIRF